MKINLKQNFIAGIVAILPVALTTYIIVWLFRFFAKPGAKFVGHFFKNEKIPQFVPEIIGFLITLLLILFLGLFVRNILGKRTLHAIEKFFIDIPIFNSIYKTIKQITNVIGKNTTQAFQKVVLIEYPRNKLWTIAMVTGSSVDSEDRPYYHLFVPTTPNPTSGYMIIIPQSDAIETDISIEEGLKIVISGGLIAPPINQIKKKVS